ncbi:hypothetical protein [Mesorhizobium sp.]|uniref:hypothetical protein n=1 Tax=Mesorhizobium sp. TaxID=1871066 RepID=UPI0025C2C0A3|nr:hypothetical protein [Mesorhizobium sp.]
MKLRRPHRPPTRWQSSAQWRAIGSAAIRAWNRKRSNLPKCNAARKRDGEPCQQIAMANGKCFIHGGRTPRGREWHRTQWPDGKSPDAEKKLQRKFAERERYAKERAARLASMSPAERERHEAWHAARKHGSAAAREQARAERKQNAEIREMMTAPRPAPTGEAAEIESQIAALQAELDARRQDEQKPIGAFA